MRNNSGLSSVIESGHAIMKSVNSQFKNCRNPEKYH